MENPFPGVDPWMESRWGDAHHSIITYARDQLRPQLPPELVARVEERVFIEGRDEPVGRLVPDLRVVERPAGPAIPARAGRPGGVIAAEPMVVRLTGDEPITQGFIEILDRSVGGRVITLIEVVSPANKTGGAGRRQYLDKQADCREAGVNLVELDLLRGGRWTVFAPEAAVPGPRDAPYRVSVWRATRPKYVEFYPVGLRERLPAVRIPLRSSDADVTLDLQPLVDLAYLNGSYDTTEYARDPMPNLSAEDRAWAVGLLKAAGRL